MVLFVLIPHHKNDRVTPDKRIGKERPPLQTDKTLINPISRFSLCRCNIPLDHRKLSQDLTQIGIFGPKDSRQVFCRRPQSLRTIATGPIG